MPRINRVDIEPPVKGNNQGGKDDQDPLLRVSKKPEPGGVFLGQ
jgi:hypothetical protein